jgi:hypothetical protein
MSNKENDEMVPVQNKGQYFTNTARVRKCMSTYICMYKNWLCHCGRACQRGKSTESTLFANVSILDQRHTGGI